MKSKTRRIILAVAVIGALAAGGAAFTAGSAIPINVAGYDTATVTGGTVTDLNYTLNADGSAINTANLQIAGDLTTGGLGGAAETVKIGFTGFQSGVLEGCTLGTFVAVYTPVTCDLTAVTGFPVPTASVTAVHVAITGP